MEPQQAALANRSATPAGMRQGLATSSGEAGVVTGLYQNVLEPQADAAGLATWEDALAGGISLAQVQQTIAQSLEAQGDLDAIISDVQGRQASAADQPWMEAQEAALGNGSISLGTIRQVLVQTTAGGKRWYDNRLERHPLHSTTLVFGGNQLHRTALASASGTA